MTCDRYESLALIALKEVSSATEMKKHRHDRIVLSTHYTAVLMSKVQIIAQHYMSTQRSAV